MSVATRPPSERSSASPTSGLMLGGGLVLLALTGVWLLVGAWREGLSGGRDFVQDYAAIIKIGEWRNPYEPYNDVTLALFGGPPTIRFQPGGVRNTPSMWKVSVPWPNRETGFSR